MAQSVTAPAAVARGADAQKAMGALQTGRDMSLHVDNVVRYAASRASARGLSVAFEVKPEVHAFMEALGRGNTNRGYLKAWSMGLWVCASRPSCKPNRSRVRPFRSL